MYHLVKIETAASTAGSPIYFYLTDAPMNIDFNGTVYQGNRITKVGALTMATGLQLHKLNIEVAGEYQEELNRGLVGPASNTSYLNKSITVNRIYLEANGNIVNMSDSNNGAYYYFQGLVTDINIKENTKQGSSTVTWSCANHFEDFNTVNGRLTDDYVHRGLVTINGVLQASQAAKRVAHQTDSGFKHANKAVDVLAKYTTKETRYKTKSSWGGFKTKTVEYQVDVVNELDLRFDLAAKYIPTIYGIRRTPGIPVFIDVDSQSTNDVYIVYVVSEGEIEGFLDVYIDGVPAICSDGTHSSDTYCLGSQQSGHTLGIANNSGVANDEPVAHGRTLNIRTEHTTADITFYNGKSDQTVDPAMNSLSNSNRFLLQDGDNTYWDSNCKLLDTAYVVVKYTVNEDATSIPEFEFVVQGKKVDVYNSPGTSTTDYSLNPAWQLLDYMYSSMYGGSIPIADFEIQSFIDVAAELDQIDTSYEMGWLKFSRYLGWKDTNAERRQKVQCNTLLPGGQPTIDNIKDVLEQFDGTLNLVDGKYYLSMKRVTSPVAAIDISDIRGAISTKAQNNKDTWNTIQANIEDPAIGWTSNKITFFNNAYKVEDRNLEKKGNISFKHITNYYTARTRAEVALNQSRYSREFTFTVWHKFSHLTPNDVVTLTYDRFGFNNKLLMVNKVVANTDGTFTLSVQDYDPSIYNVSGQSDNGSNEGVVSPGVPRPTDLHVDDYFGEEIGVYGVFNWQGVSTGALSHYEVKEGNNRYVVPLNQKANIQITGEPATFRGTRPYMELKDLVPQINYTFSVRTVLLDGRASSWVSASYTAEEINSNLPLVTGFRVINLEPGYEDKFYGADVELEWDGIVDDNVTGYKLEIISGNEDGASDELRTVYGSYDISLVVTEPTKATFTYLQADNIQHYADVNANAVGIHRDLGFRIKATNANGGLSREWTYIE